MCMLICSIQGKGVSERMCLPPSHQKKEITRADSIMQQVITHAAVYEHLVESNEADIYVKGETNVLKKNFLISFAHQIFPVERHPHNAVFEMYSHSQFHAPNHYRHDIKAVNSNRLTTGQKYKNVLSFVNLNIYSPTIYNKDLIMPIATNAFKYYTFTLEGTKETEGLLIYTIRFTPRQWSQKLLSGSLQIVDENWTIDQIDLNGHSSFSDFRLQMTFSRNINHFLLPERADLHVRFAALGNALESDFHTAFRYQAVAYVEEYNKDERKEPLDQTQYFSLTADTIPIVRDTVYWAARRDKSLTPAESSVYFPAPTADNLRANSDSNLFTPYIKLGERLTSTVNMDYKTTRIKYSGLFNPFQLAYSRRNGVTYHQQVRISKTFAGDRQLRFHPEIGYLFKKKEVRFKVAADFEYLPERLGAVSLVVANDNQGYSSEIMEKISEQLKDSSFNFDDLHLKSFHHYYAELRNTIELFNGFQLQAGVSYHRRVPAGKSNKEEAMITDLINGKYHDFTPAISFSYTPRQYYWMDEHRKEYLNSHYPTLTAEVARGIPGILGSTGNYGRFEAALHQRVKTGLSEQLSYHVGAGLFFNQQSTYFADFHYFAKRYFPESWNDRFGGVFHNLQGEWYNASDKYVQVHLMYESPSLLLRFLNPKVHKYLLSERLYLSQLWTPVLPSYSELGYGVGSDLFSAAAFVGFDSFRYRSFGLKFALELF